MCGCVAEVAQRLLLTQLFAGGGLSGLQKGFDEFAFAANGQAGKLLEPFSLRHLGFSREPVGEESKLVGGDVPPADAIEQVGQKLRWKIVAANARHGYSP